MEVKPGYKQTDVGVIPEDWEVRRIGAVCKLINGRGFKPFEWQRTGLPIIRIQNLNGSDDFNYYSGTYDRKLEVSWASCYLRGQVTGGRRLAHTYGKGHLACLTTTLGKFRFTNSKSARTSFFTR